MKEHLSTYYCQFLEDSESEVRTAALKRLSEFGKYIDLPVLDHIIFTDNGYFSFSDHGIIL